MATNEWQRKRVRDDDYADIATGGTLGFTEHRSVRPPPFILLPLRASPPLCASDGRLNSAKIADPMALQAILLSCFPKHDTDILIHRNVSKHCRLGHLLRAHDGAERPTSPLPIPLLVW